MELTHPLTALPQVDAWARSQIAALCQEVGLTDADFDPLFSPYLVVAFTTSALTGEQPFPGHFILVGPAMLERPRAFEWDLLDPARRKVLITVGTLATGLAGDFYQRAAAAVAPLRATVQAIIVGPPDLLPDAPGNVLVVPSVPMLARVRPSQLREAAVSILNDPSYRRAAKRIGESFAAAGGAPAAAARLERAVQAARLAIRGCPTPRVRGTRTMKPPFVPKMKFHAERTVVSLHRNGTGGVRCLTISIGSFPLSR